MPKKPKPESKSIDEMSRGELGKYVADIITGARNATHGDPHRQFACAQMLKATFAEHAGKLNYSQAESIDLILTKVSRLANGDANWRDTWLDIAGYALIAAESCE